MDLKEVKIGRCFTACTGQDITSILKISLMEGASYRILKSVRHALRYSLDTLMDTSPASLNSTCMMYNRTCRLYP